MKNKYLRCFVCLFAMATCLLSACSKDLGNYEYQEINDGQITDIADSYSSLRGAVLSIKPTLLFTQDDGSDTTKYTYSWSIINQSSLPITKTLIAKTKLLNWPVSISASTTAYTLLYEVKEIKTGLIFRKSTFLNVTTNIADGWLVLNDINGEARLDFLNYISATGDFQAYTDVLSTQSTLKLNGSPKFVYFWNRRDPYSFAIHKAIAVGTDQATNIINTQDGTFSNFANISKMMSSYSPPPYYAQNIVSQASSYLAYLYDSNGELFFENATLQNSWGTRVNKTSAAVNFKISPFYAEAYKNSTTYALLFDLDNKRFMEHKSSNTSSSVPVPKGNVYSDNNVDPGNLNMDLMYMASTPALGSRTYAVLKNSSDELFLTTIQCNATTFTPLTWDKISTAPEMINATQFAIDPNEGYLMYLVGSKVYRYNISDKTNVMVVDMGSRKVSLIKYHKLTQLTTAARYVEYANKLIVCSYDEANPTVTGKMDLYNVPNLNNAVSLYKSFTGFGKIVSISYRE